MIRDLIFQKTRLTASAGIAPNKLVAKIASDVNKPNGQLEVTPEQVPVFMAQLPVRKIWGIGPATEKKLNEMGIEICGQLQKFSRIELQQLFGRWGIELYDLARGIDDRTVEPDRPRKSPELEETFSYDLETLPQCTEQVGQLYEELMAELAQKEPKRAVTKIFLKLKFNDFTRTTVERAGSGAVAGVLSEAPRRRLRADRKTGSLDRCRCSLCGRAGPRRRATVAV